MIVDIIPCVVGASLETDAFTAIVASRDFFFKKNQGFISKFRSNEFFSTESCNGIERFSGTHFTISGWYKIEFGKQKGNLEELS